MADKSLLLWLEAPLQSWGCDSKFGRRTTCKFPTRSGIAGLLLCAMGASGEQVPLLARLALSSQTVVAYGRGRSDGKNAASTTSICDFHMVGSGYDDADPWQSLMIPKTSEGKKAVGGGTKMTYRDYLQDAFFAVVLTLPEDLASSFHSALGNPVFDIFLGRRCCAPTDFIPRGVFDSEDAALRQAGEISRGKSLAEIFRVLDGEHPERGEVFSINDIPVQFGERKRYRDRRATMVRLS